MSCNDEGFVYDGMSENDFIRRKRLESYESRYTRRNEIEDADPAKILCAIDTLNGKQEEIYYFEEDNKIVANADLIQEAMSEIMKDEEHRDGYWNWYIKKNGDVVGFAETRQGWTWEKRDECDE